MDLRIGQVSVDAPRLTVVTPARSDVTLAGVTMAVQYVGTGVVSATYAPIETQGDTQLLFQLDSQVFNQPLGFFLGVLLFNGEPFAQCSFRYTTSVSIPSPLQLSTTGAYIPPIGYACPNWSGTGVSGPGTFIGLKDCPAGYSGAAGYDVKVNVTETGLVFLPQSASTGGVSSFNSRTGAVAPASGDYTFAQLGSIPTTLAGYGITDAATATQGGKADTAVQAVVAGANVTVDNTDPLHPVVSATSGGATTLTGDVTGTGTGTVATTLATSGATAGTYGDATHVAQFAVDAKGRITSAVAVAISAGGSGTVTSVGLTLPADFTVAGSPVTGAGTLAVTRASQTAKFFLAAPNASAGAPTYRAVVASDIPTLNQSTTGSAATLTTARTIAGVSFNGGANIAIPFSGLSSQPTTLSGYGITDALANPMTAVGDMIVGGTAGAPARVPVGADGTFLAADSTAPLGVSYKTPAGGSGSNLYVNTTAAGNVGTGVQNLMGYAVPGGTLATAGDILRARASFSAASTINAKSFQIKFGATTVFDSAGSIPVSAADDLVVDVEIIMVTGTTQLCNVSVTSGNTTFAASAKITASGETLSGSVTLQCTGSATTTNDIVQKSLSVWKGVGGGSGGATLPAGSQIGFKNTASATKVSGTGTFPEDNTIPQITEGNSFSYLDTSYTPKSATSLLEIEINLPLISTSFLADFLVGLFQDAIANALAVSTVSVDTAGYFRQVGLRVIVPAASTAARTYRVRYGANTGTSYIGQDSLPLYSTSLIAVMTIKEISQ